jgi:hypothetical protein
MCRWLLPVQQIIASARSLLPSKGMTFTSKAPLRSSADTTSSTLSGTLCADAKELLISYRTVAIARKFRHQGNYSATHFNLIAMSSVLPALLGAFVLQVHVLVGAAAGKVLMLLWLAACVLATLAAAEPSLSEVGVENQRFSCSGNCEQAQGLLHCLPALTARASMLYSIVKL